MDIAALSMAFSYTEVMQAANVSILDKAMEAQTAELARLLETMPAQASQAAPPSEHILDILV